MKKITKKTLISDVVEVNENAGDILMEAGMGCIGCAMAHGETIEEGCLAHGLDKKEIDALIKKLNKE